VITVSSPQLDAATLSQFIWFELEDNIARISCMACYGPGSTFYDGYYSKMGNTPWLVDAAQHVLDKHL